MREHNLVDNTDIKVSFSFLLKHCEVSAFDLLQKFYSRQKISYFSVNKLT